MHLKLCRFIIASIWFYLFFVFLGLWKLKVRNLLPPLFFEVEGREIPNNFLAIVASLSQQSASEHTGTKIYSLDGFALGKAGKVLFEPLVSVKVI